uniref:transcription factor bHLH57-like n=1 Tax=Fragaria vesca subsp. vesca TaxID=101020 RepID=UPI0005CA250C|nr:PREDICTED: transcription factor bHLH57-like [Fragaria vesca subsp. vesca]
MPFLQMLQSIDFPPNFTPKEPSFQPLLRHHLNNTTTTAWPKMESTKNAQIHTLGELESCVTQDNQQQLYSPANSEGQDPHQNNPLSGTVEVGGGGGGVVSSDCNQKLQQLNSAKMSPIQTQTHLTKTASSPATRERQKRKRTRPTKNKEEVESQRMTHIAVERNRRCQMNDHLNVLRSLMPPSYIQRGDQASIVGGAIDFVKELEQHLQSLEAQKRTRRAEGFTNTNVDPNNNNSMTSSSPSSSSTMTMPSNGMFMSLSQCRIGSTEEGNTCGDDGVTAQNKSEAAEVDVTVIQTHVNLKVQCQKRPGQLVRALVAIEDIRLTVLHLNITSSEDEVLYSFNLKIEEGCKLGSADDIARAVH